MYIFFQETPIILTAFLEDGRNSFYGHWMVGDVVNTTVPFEICIQNEYRSHLYIQRQALHCRHMRRVYVFVHSGFTFSV